MNIILVSNHLGKSRSITLGTWQILGLTLVMAVMVWVAGLLLQYALVRLAPSGLSDGVRNLLVSLQSEEREKQASYVNSSLDAMAARVGQMQANIQRLDALGARLAKLTGMKPEEFEFDRPPPQGGPLVPVPGDSVSMNGLQNELARMSRLITDRSDKLMALETLLMQDQLSSRMLPSVAPIVGGYYSSNFGWRTDPFTGTHAMHEGVDFVVPEGTPIRASAGGVVAYAAKHPQYGNLVEIDHGNDIVTRYAHASKLLVKVGQVVRRGEKVAEVGSTGRSTGNHLHFEVRYKGAAQNPVRFLRKAAG